MTADELKNDEDGQVVGGARNSATKLYMLSYAHLYVFNIICHIYTSVANVTG